MAHSIPSPSRHSTKSLILAALLAALLVLVLGIPNSLAQTAQQRQWQPLNRFPHMVQEYFVDQVRQIEQQNERRRAALQTRADAEAFVADVQQRIARCFGPWPEKTPLNPRITGTVERDAYTIENLIFESRPNFLVTANLYIPKGRDFPLPGIVGTCGHSATGKAVEPYQSFAQGLARQGYVVLIFDPVGQGERLIYPNADLQYSLGGSVREHLYAGNQQFLVGESLAAWRAWDGIRALDYLLTRKEVDPEQIGVTGNSGGGTMTMWLCGVEPRWTMAAPSCAVTTFGRNIENELPTDTEQCPTHALALGLDHQDFLAAMAPKPVIILAKEKDFFDVRGAESAYQSLQRLYRLFDAEDNIGLFVGPTYHGYSQENREAMYRWFNRVTEICDARSEPNLIIEKDETLRCTPRGQVSVMGSKPIYEFTKEKSQALAQQRPTDFTLPELQRRIRQVLYLPASTETAAPEYRVLRNWRSRGYPQPRWTTYLVETEPRIQTVVYRLGKEPLLSRPQPSTKKATLYVAHLSSDAELRDEPLIAEMIAADPNTDFYTLDVRGIGESRPDTCDEDSYFNPYGSDYFYAITSIMLDKPYVGQRTYDVLRVIDWLTDAGYDQVHLAGKGWGAVPATFAAVLSDRVTQITLKNAPTSYSDIAESKTYAWPLSTLVPDILTSFDLPDCYRAMKAKRLRQIEPWNADAKPAD